MSIVRRLNFWLTRSSCMSGMDRKTSSYFPDRFSRRKMKCGCTFDLGVPATFLESAELSCACPIFCLEKFADPTRYAPPPPASKKNARLSAGETGQAKCLSLTGACVSHAANFLIRGYLHLLRNHLLTVGLFCGIFLKLKLVLQTMLSYHPFATLLASFWRMRICHQELPECREGLH